MSPPTDTDAEGPPDADEAADELGAALQRAAGAAPRQVDLGGDEVNQDGVEIAADDSGASSLAESGEEETQPPT